MKGPVAGERFGLWAATGRSAVRGNGRRAHVVYELICGCGTVKLLPLHRLATGESRSCGCARAKHLAAAWETRPRVPLETRFWPFVNKTPACWLWTGATTPYGYGTIAVGRKTILAHRVAYLLVVGPIPSGLTIDHLCRVRSCVNPAHMEPVPGRINTLRGEGVTAKQARKTHCQRGHAYDEANTHLDPRGHRSCKECHRAHCRAQRRKKSLAALNAVRRKEGA